MKRFADRIQRHEFGGGKIAYYIAGDEPRYLYIDPYNGEGKEEFYQQALYDLDGWIPELTPYAGDSFFGFDRSVDPMKWAGLRISCSGMPIEESVHKCAREVARNSGRATALVLPEDTLFRLSDELNHQGKVLFNQDGDLIIHSVSGPIECFADDVSDGFMLQLDTWGWCGVEENDFEKWRGTVACSAPGYNARLLNLGA